MADPLSALQNIETMENSPENAVDEALKVRRKRKKQPQQNLPPSKLAHYLGEQMLKSAYTSDAQTSAKYGPAALAGISTAKPRGGKMCSGNGWGNIHGSTSITSAPGIAKMALAYPALAKFAASSIPTAPGNSGAVGPGPSGALGSPGAAPGAGFASAPAVQAPGAMQVPGAAMVPPKAPKATGGLISSITGSGKGPTLKSIAG